MPFNFIVIPAIIIATAYYGSKYVRQGLKPWYKQLHKPKWTPSGKLIREIWTFLYVLTGLAILWYWNVPVAGWFKYVVAVVLLVNAYYNLIWNKVFFVEHNFDKSSRVIKYVLGSAILATLLMTVHSPIAAFIMLPYIAWLIIATRLAKEIGKLNQGSHSK